jgi:two-component system LytT family response regulator
MEEMLEDYSFLRVHHSHIVNLNEISKYVKGEGGYLVMSDGSAVDVSRSRKNFSLKNCNPASIIILNLKLIIHYNSPTVVHFG